MRKGRGRGREKGKGEKRGKGDRKTGVERKVSVKWGVAGYLRVGFAISSPRRLPS